MYSDSLLPVIDAAANALRPPRRLPLAEWANEYFRLSSEASAQAGAFRCLPYQVEPLNAMSPDSPYAECVLMFGAQLSKTTLMMIALAHSIVEDPGPCLVVQPNLEMAETWSKDRFAPLVRDTPILQERMAESRARDAGSTIRHRRFIGGAVTIVGSNSPSGLASRPIKLLLLDEVDRFEPSAGSEGNPSSLAIARTKTYYNRKILWASTPTIKNESEIAAKYAESDQRELEVPCPHCRFFQVLSWQRVEWPDDDPERAWYRCAGCSEVIQHHKKAAMVAAGRWVARNPGSRIAGFRLSELNSPFRSWGELAVDWLKSYGNIEKRRAFINTSLCELFDDEEQASISENTLMARCENLGTGVPELAAAITAGVDVQGNRIEVSFYAWGSGEESWLLWHRVIAGDPSTPKVWEELDHLLMTTWQHPLLGSMSVHAVAIDSGHFTSIVTAFCDQRRGRRIFAIKGAYGKRSLWPKKQSKAAKGKVYIVGVDGGKEILSHRLKIAEDGPGRIHFPVATWCHEEFFSQLTSEYVRTLYKRGRPERTWIRRFGRAAEALDCAVYALSALAGLKTFGIDLEMEVERLRAMKAADSPAAVPAYQVNKSRFLTGGMRV